MSPRPRTSRPGVRLLHPTARALPRTSPQPRRGPRPGRRGGASLVLAAGLASLVAAGAPVGAARAATSTPDALALRPTAPLAAGTALGATDEDDATTSGAAPTTTGDAPSSGDAGGRTPDRLAVAARELRSTPFVVDPELDWQYDRSAVRRIVRVLRGARVPFFVVALPSIEEDESGGDLERVVQRLQREVGRPGVYVAIDQRARMDLASVGVPLDLQIPFGLLFPPRDDRPYEVQARDPGPPPWTTVADRLTSIVQRTAVAERGTPNGVVDDVDELRPLASQNRADQRAEDALAAVLFGGFLGLVAAATFLGIRGAVRGGRRALAQDRAARAGTTRPGTVDTTSDRDAGRGRRGRGRGRRGGRG